MKVALIGICGRVGSRLAPELLARGHGGTGIARNPEKAIPRAGITMKQGDATQSSMLGSLIADHNTIIGYRCHTIPEVRCKRVDRSGKEGWRSTLAGKEV